MQAATKQYLSQPQCRCVLSPATPGQRIGPVQKREATLSNTDVLTASAEDDPPRISTGSAGLDEFWVAGSMLGVSISRKARPGRARARSPCSSLDPGSRWLGRRPEFQRHLN